MRRYIHGFTLVEMAIVLIVIATVVGGILVGTSLLKSTQLQSVVADVNRYKNAMKLFQEKYHYFPGDMPGATSVWSTSDNGNGDGFIAGTDGTPVDIGATDWQEHLRAWQHLALSGFIEGSYSGAGATLVVKTNIPLSNFRRGTGFTLHYAKPGMDTSYYRASYRHILVFGNTEDEDGNAIDSDHPAYGPILSHAEALTLDQKLDDGKPSSGAVLAYANNGGDSGVPTPTPDCASAVYNNPIGATYLIGDDRKCSLIFITGF